MSKKTSVKALSFEDQMTVLEALPPADANTEMYTSTKSIHYMILNEMLTPSPQLAEKWETLDKN